VLALPTLARRALQVFIALALIVTALAASPLAHPARADQCATVDNSVVCVDNLVTQVEQQLNNIVNPDSAIALVEQLAAEGLLTAEQCASQSNPTCRTVIEDAELLTNEVAAEAVSCVDGSNTTCNQVVALVEQEANSLENTVIQCVDDSTSVCNLVLNTARQVAAAAVADAVSCVNGTFPTCSEVEQLANQEVQALEQAALSCASGTNPTCNQVIGLVEAEILSAVDVVSACVGHANGTCNTVLDAISNVQQLAIGCVVDGAHQAGVGQSIEATGDGLNCAGDVALAQSVAGLAVATAEGCVGGQNSTCNTIIAAAQGGANAALGCVDQATKALGVPLIGNSTGFDSLGCGPDAALAKSLADEAVATAQACANGQNATCNTAIQLAEGVAELVVTTVTTCVNGTNSTCNTAVQTLESTIGTAQGLLSQGLPICTGTCSIGAADVTNDSGTIVIGHDFELALADQGASVTPPVTAVVGTPGRVTGTFDTATDAEEAGDVNAAANPGNYSGSCDPNGDVTYQYTPKTATAKDQGISESYTVVPYQRNHAHFRPDTLEFTWQMALCAFGGAKTYHGWRLSREGVGVSLIADASGPSQNVKIGQDWDTTVSDSTSSGSVNFQVDLGPASVGATIGTGGDGVNDGDASVQGPQSPDYACKFSCTNTVHGFWRDNSPFYVPPSNRGVSSFRGSVDLGLYEMGETSQPSIHWLASIFFHRNCSMTRGCPT
jgi:hypothetical protein